MRLWLIILMFATTITFFLRLRSNLFQRLPTKNFFATNRLGQISILPQNIIKEYSQKSPASSYVMAEALPQQNPMPVPSQAGPADADKVRELPKLSTEDFRVYNRLAVIMDAYHNHFRSTWNMLYKAASSGQRPAGVSIRGFIHSGLQLCQQLTMHHTIEEQYVFPELAERMPIFKENGLLITQHEQIHEGLEKMQKYLQDCQFGKTELRLNELKDIMDTFGKVLWTHLDEEVKTLGADNIRKYYTKEEVMAIRW